MLGAFAVGAAEITARKQMFVHTHGAVVFPAPAEQIAQRKVQLGGVGIVLHRLDKGVNGLILLLIKQKIQPFEVGLWCTAIFSA